MLEDKTQQIHSFVKTDSTHLKLLPEPRLPVHILVLLLQLADPLGDVGREEGGGVERVLQVDDGARGLHHRVALIVLDQARQGVEGRSPSHVKDPIPVPDHDVGDSFVHAGREDIKAGVVHGGAYQEAAVLSLRQE